VGGTILGWLDCGVLEKERSRERKMRKKIRDLDIL